MTTEQSQTGNLEPIAVFAAREGFSEQKARRLARRGEIPSVRIGGRIYIPRREYDPFLAELSRRSMVGGV